jgi:class 3 adenylate cyclase
MEAKGVQIRRLRQPRSLVILARRTAGKAQGDEIVVADVVRLLVAGEGFTFTDRGETEMEGFEEPVRVFEVRWQG